MRAGGRDLNKGMSKSVGYLCLTIMLNISKPLEGLRYMPRKPTGIFYYILCKISWIDSKNFSDFSSASFASSSSMVAFSRP
jgi:hypothetical protein